MFRIIRRRTPELGVRFCDSCAEVTTADERARRRYDRTRADVQAFTWPR